VLVLISFVLGALRGVGIWFTSIQISAATIGEMVFNFHWIWATEWTFFCLEVVSGYGLYRYHRQLSDRTCLTPLTRYAVAAWMSLLSPVRHQQQSREPLVISCPLRAGRECRRIFSVCGILLDNQSSAES